MYTQQDLTDIRNQAKKRWIVLAIPMALCIIGVVISLIVRIEILTDVFSILFGVLLIGGYELFIKPLNCYANMLNGVLNGITHELTDSTFLHLDEDVSMVDGVAYYSFTVQCIDEKNKPYERLFYYDAQKPRISFPVGTPLRLVYHDRSLSLVEAI